MRKTARVSDRLLGHPRVRYGALRVDSAPVPAVDSGINTDKLIAQLVGSLRPSGALKDLELPVKSRNERRVYNRVRRKRLEKLIDDLILLLERGEHQVKEHLLQEARKKEILSDGRDLLLSWTWAILAEGCSILSVLHAEYSRSRWGKNKKLRQQIQGLSEKLQEVLSVLINPFAFSEDFLRNNKEEQRSIEETYLNLKRGLSVASQKGKRLSQEIERVLHVKKTLYHQIRCEYESLIADLELLESQNDKSPLNLEEISSIKKKIEALKKVYLGPMKANSEKLNNLCRAKNISDKEWVQINKKLEILRVRLTSCSSPEEENSGIIYLFMGHCVGTFDLANTVFMVMRGSGFNVEGLQRLLRRIYLNAGDLFLLKVMDFERNSGYLETVSKHTLEIVSIFFSLKLHENENPLSIILKMDERYRIHRCALLLPLAFVVAGPGYAHQIFFNFIQVWTQIVDRMDHEERARGFAHKSFSLKSLLNNIWDMSGKDALLVMEVYAAAMDISTAFYGKLCALFSGYPGLIEEEGVLYPIDWDFACKMADPRYKGKTLKHIWQGEDLGAEPFLDGPVSAQASVDEFVSLFQSVGATAERFEFEENPSINPPRRSRLGNLPGLFKGMRRRVKPSPSDLEMIWDEGTEQSAILESAL